MPKIDRMYAFVADYKGDGDEGIMAFLSPANGTWTPLVGADMARVKQALPFAQEISRKSGKPFKILLFEGRRDVTQAVLEGQNFG
jgi:hypothetical protein